MTSSTSSNSSTASTEEPGKKIIQILCIEDDLDYCQIIQWSFLRSSQSCNCNFICHFAHSIKDAKEALSRTKFDVILLDLTLPDSTKEDAFNDTKAIQSNFKKPLIIVITGHDDMEYGEKLVKEGAQDYLIKSENIDPERLARTVVFGLTRHQREVEFEESMREILRRLEEIQKERVTRKALREQGKNPAVAGKK